MRQRAVEIVGGARDPRGEKLRGGIARAGLRGWSRHGRAPLQFRSWKTARRPADGCSIGSPGCAAQALFAKLARLVRPPGIKGGGGAANDVLGGVLGHGRHIRTEQWVCKDWLTSPACAERSPGEAQAKSGAGGDSDESRSRCEPLTPTLSPQSGGERERKEHALLRRVAALRPAPDNPCSPWRRRRRTSPCPAR